eukprot:TRINITY_DN7468_c0_g1_i1.p1 TRINITY_DN7468_c0_g1~~TRINITY_DN7468_c0_g1_i1.p1  ORF type:complete len:228 (-),score=45.91 TRINITY_DN7468_c0_g1_i1:695-1378(-)
MRVSYVKVDGQGATEDEVPAFLREELTLTRHVRTGFDIDFPAIHANPAVHAALGYKGQYFSSGRMDIKRWWNERDRSIVGSVYFTKGCEGPPGVTHGGAIATALDDVLGTQVWRYAGYHRRGMPTMSLTIRYIKKVPMETLLVVRASVTRVLGRRVHVMGGLYEPLTGEPYAEADGVFFLPRAVDPEDLLPYEEALRRFGRLAPAEDQVPEIRAYYAARRPSGMAKL